MTRKLVAISSAWAALALGQGSGLLATPAQAGGLFLPGYGPQALGRGGAFVARADDPSALHHNPAGFARLEGTVLQLGTSLLDLSLTYQRAGVYEAAPRQELGYEGQAYAPVSDESSPAVGVGPFQAVPVLAVGSDMGLGKRVPGLRVGLGVLAPHSYAERSFAADYAFEAEGVPPPPQRYDVVAQRAVVAMPSVALAYRVHELLDVGVRASWGIARLEAESHVWGIDNYEEWVGRDGLFALDVRDDYVPAYGAGVLFRPVSWLELGAAYASALHVDARGTGTVRLGSGLGLGIPGSEPEEILPENDTPRCAAGGTADALETCFTLDLPQTATLGARWVLRDAAGAERADIELDIAWEDWSAASDFRIIVDGKSKLTGSPLEEVVVRHGLQDVLSVRLGGSYSMRAASRRLTVRGGLAHDTAAAPESWQRLDVDGAARTSVTAGAAYELGRIRIDVAGGVVLEGERTVAACNPMAGSLGCPPGSGETPVVERTGPDPLQPLKKPLDQEQSPFNAGTYTSRYILLGLGITAYF